MKQNPLLELPALPTFSQIKVHHIVPAIDYLLDDNKKQVEQLLNATEQYTWDNLVQPMEELDERLSRTWSPVSHMNSVVNAKELREAYNACLPKISNYSTEMGQNKRLDAAFKYIANSSEFKQLHHAQQKIINNQLRDFRLSGVELDEQDKRKYKTLMETLTQLNSKFEENVLDATHAWTKHIADEKLLDGLPESTKQLAQQAANTKEKTGWLLTLEFPSYYPTMCYADSRQLREEMYEAYVTRASDEGPHKGKWDNSEIMADILAARYDSAQLLGFNNYAERSLASKMAKDPAQVVSFLTDLAERSLPMAKAELDELRQYAEQQHQQTQLEAWDIAYYSEKLRQHKYAISQQELKPYFPEKKVLQGMFAVVSRLYGLHIEAQQGIDTWHKDVHFFNILDSNDQLRGQFYLDLYARENKRGGAWMDEYSTRMKRNSTTQTPVAYLTCNFSPPIGHDPALFTHDEVLTLFHEFGHGLHHMLTQVDYPSVSGISGVAWDAVELPSQFMENWCWQREALNLISGHYQTGEPLPENLFEKMLAAKNFQAGMQMVRQLELALFDFRLHLNYDPQQGARIFDVLDEVRHHVAVIKPPSFNRFPHSFSHIFAGGYAAGYYSYKWAEVLSSDAFAKFEEKGIFDRPTGLQFLTSILEQGGSKEPMELFIEFRGREPQIDALLRHSGISAMDA